MPTLLTCWNFTEALKKKKKKRSPLEKAFPASSTFEILQHSPMLRESCDKFICSILLRETACVSCLAQRRDRLVSLATPTN